MLYTLIPQERHAAFHPNTKEQTSSEHDLAMDPGLALGTSSSVILIILQIVKDVKADAAKNVFKPAGNIVHRARPREASATASQYNQPRVSTLDDSLVAEFHADSEEIKNSLVSDEVVSGDHGLCSAVCASYDNVLCNDNELFTSSEMVEFLQNDDMFEVEKVTLVIYQIVFR